MSRNHPVPEMFALHTRLEAAARPSVTSKTRAPPEKKSWALGIVGAKALALFVRIGHSVTKDI